MTPEIYRTVDLTTDPPIDKFQVKVAGRFIADFDTGPEARAFVRGFEAGAHSALCSAAFDQPPT